MSHSLPSRHPAVLSRALLPCIGQLVAHPGRGAKLRLACEWRHRPDTFAETERRFGEQRWRFDDIEYRTNPSRRFGSRELRLVDLWLTLLGDGPPQWPDGRGVLYQPLRLRRALAEIGRAQCRRRGYQYVSIPDGAVELNKKKPHQRKHSTN